MNAVNASQPTRQASTRLRIRFTKCGDLRWIGHKDLARVWERLLRRAGLRLAFTEGFHPKPKISFPSALALGIEALDELVELEILGSFNLDQIQDAIVRQLPPGMELRSIEALEPGSGKAKVVGATYRVELSDVDLDAVGRKLNALLATDAVTLQRDKKSIVCPVGPDGLQASLEGTALTFTLPHLAQGSIRPQEFLQLLGLEDLLDKGALLQRTAVHLQDTTARDHRKNRSKEQKS